MGPSIAAPDDGNPVGLMRIAKIGLDKVIVQGTSTNDLRQGPGHYPGTPLPGEVGNAAIAGHRTTYGAPFYNLDELVPGDPIVITTVQGTFTYSVTGTVIVSPNDTSVVDNTTFPELTLTTCNPRFSASQRLVVHARSTTAPRPPRPSARRASWGVGRVDERPGRQSGGLDAGVGPGAAERGRDHRGVGGGASATLTVAAPHRLRRGRCALARRALLLLRRREPVAARQLLNRV